ncbi:MAG: hypothetical protein ABSD89_13690 [Halobacteriota archaeon]|jgi:hypothetical protein
MADIFVCETCEPPMEFATSRGLKIHNTRVHGENSQSDSVDLTTAKSKLDSIIFRSKPSAMINIPLRGMARTYGDPSICLSPSEASDIDGIIQDIMAEMGADSKVLARISPLMPWIALLFVGTPIILDKWDKIQAARAGARPEVPKSPPQSADGSRPTLARKDVMPDA